jgi:lysozyme
MNDEDIKKQIKQHEGYREQVYYDTVGVPTGGYGHAFLNGSRLPQSVCDILFECDYQSSVRSFKMFASQYGLDLNDVRRGILINMFFNMGYYRVIQFKKMILALQRKDWDLAADEMMDSKWYRQVGYRGIELVKLMRKGE